MTKVLERLKFPTSRRPPATKHLPLLSLSPLFLVLSSFLNHKNKMPDLLTKPRSELTAQDIEQLQTLVVRHRVRAKHYADSGDFRSAMREHLSIVPYLDRLYTDQSVEFADGMLNLGICATQMGEWGGAAEAFEAALKVREVSSEKEDALGKGRPEDLLIVREWMARLKENKGEMGMDGGQSLRCTELGCQKEKIDKEIVNVCGGCRCAFYCSSACQRSDWRRHKAACKQYGAQAKSQVA
ncbi:hypothetical protein BDQ17DRAFT_1356926 [Cyathus striatus]|nr:hypothetical protein BDQ17DRAFT_1356926 [Cyathus striatus]